MTPVDWPALIITGLLLIVPGLMMLAPFFASRDDTEEEKKWFK